MKCNCCGSQCVPNNFDLCSTCKRYVDEVIETDMLFLTDQFKNNNPGRRVQTKRRKENGKINQ